MGVSAEQAPTAEGDSTAAVEVVATLAEAGTDEHEKSDADKST
jgi:hypothetical protein